MNTKLLVKAAVVALLITACSSEENAATSTNKNNLARESRQSPLSVLQDKAIANAEQRFTFTAGREQISFRSESGVRIDIDGNSLTKNGAPVSGTLTLVYVELFDYAHMITSNKTTMGIVEGSNPERPELKPLESGGEFFVNVITEKGESLDDANFTLTVPVELTGRTDSRMIAWEGIPTDRGDVTWDKDPDGTREEIQVPVVDGNYILDFGKFGWCNIDIYKAYNGPRTTIKVVVPTQFNFSNSAAYLAVEGAQNTIAPLDTFDNALNAFSEHYGEVPVGLQGHIIFVSEQGGEWLYAIKSVTFTTNGTITINDTDIATATESSLIASLSGLQ